jgi:catechol 2,3-dioxygenase-like lactoylglutathione lyase family enzyme
MTKPLTQGAHHIGLTVADIETSADFFITLLGWQEVGRNPDYPAIFVSDGQTVITLWASKDKPTVPFNNKRNVGLHHLALAVASEQVLNDLAALLQRQGIAIEFTPEPLGQGPARHMMCYEPGGIRIEFIWPG